MQRDGTIVEDTFAEAFRMWAARLIVTAADEHWVGVAAREACGYGTSVIGCDAEAAVERVLPAGETPDARPGAAVLLFAFNADALGKAVFNRTGQCIMTCPTTAVYDGLPDVEATDASARLDLGRGLRFFGDGHQKSKVVHDGRRPRRYWRVPVMDGEFTVEETVGAVKAIGGGNFLICGEDPRAALDAARRAVEAMAPLPDVITPFPGGVVRSGSKVGSRYKGMFASTNDAFCPTIRGRTLSRISDRVRAVYEIVIDGLSEPAIAAAMKAGIEAACGPGIAAISAGNYGGNLGKFHFHLHEVMGERDGGRVVSGFVLTWRPTSGPAPVDGAVFRPDTVGGLDRDGLAATCLWIGRRQVRLDEVAEIAEEMPRHETQHDDAAPRLTLRNFPALDRLGAAMTGGELIVEGDSGDDLGASMSGGSIRVTGRAGHRIGGPDRDQRRGMSGGEILVHGEAGDLTGFRMRGGVVAVAGRCGASPGFRMLAGTVAAARGPWDHPGLEMRRGTILCLDARHRLHVGPNFTDHGVFPASALPVITVVLRRLAVLGWPPVAGDAGSSTALAAASYRLYGGDALELNRGEVLHLRE